VTLGRRVAAITALGVITTLPCTGIASADVPVDKKLTWNGTFPIIGRLAPIKWVPEVERKRNLAESDDDR